MHLRERRMLGTLAVVATVTIGVVYVAAVTVPGFTAPPIQSIVAVIMTAVLIGTTSAFSRRGHRTEDTDMGVAVRTVHDGALPHRTLAPVHAWAPARGAAAPAGPAFSYHGREAAIGDRTLDHVVTF
jgi:hypothetical protein